MLVDSQKLKQLRLSKNWTQQHFAEICDLSMRTIQRVEKDGVASNETVGAYAAVFGLSASDLLITVDAYENRYRGESLSKQTQLLMGVIFVGGVASGICLTLWFV